MAELRSTTLFNDGSLVAYYRFENGALTTDSKGTNTLTAGGSPSSTNGKYGGGVGFTASDTFVTANQFTSGGSFSLNCWYLNCADGFYIASIKSSGYEHYFTVGTQANQINFLCQHTDSTNVGHQATVPGGFNTNAWHMITYTTDGQCNIDIYLDAVSVYSGQDVGKNPGVCENSFNINKLFFEGSGQTTGTLDDMSFFSKKLVASEVKILYTDTNAGFLFNLI